MQYQVTVSKEELSGFYTLADRRERKRRGDLLVTKQRKSSNNNVLVSQIVSDLMTLRNKM